jgi:hypothetical protein
MQHISKTHSQRPIHLFPHGNSGPIEVTLQWDLGAGWSSPVARQAHNLKVTGSNPVPATKPHKTTIAALTGGVVVWGKRNQIRYSRYNLRLRTMLAVRVDRYTLDVRCKRTRCLGSDGDIVARKDRAPSFFV